MLRRCRDSPARRPPDAPRQGARQTGTDRLKALVNGVERTIVLGSYREIAHRQLTCVPLQPGSKYVWIGLAETEGTHRNEGHDLP